MMQRNTIVPILSVVFMFGMFVYYDLTSSTQYSVVDSVLPVIFLGIVTLLIVVVRSKNRDLGEPSNSMTFAALAVIVMSLLGKRNTDSISVGGVNTPPDSIPKQNRDNSGLKENLHHRITKMLDENDKYDEFTVTTILKELENIR